jgi:hypothetical protein
MAENAGDIIKDSLIEITALGAEAPVEPTDAQGAIRYLNRMMASLDARGIDLGYTEINNFADTVTVPDGANEGIVFLLATRLWNQYSGGNPIPDTLVAAAVSGIKAMRAIAVTVGATEYPDTLPIGSGNEGDATYITSHFYADLQDDILAETTGSIGLESGTE